MPPREHPAPVAAARLKQHRRPLRRRRHQRQRIDPVLRTVMPHPAHPGRVGEPAGLAHHRAVVPASLPQRVDRRHELVRQVVTVVMGHLGGEPHRTGGAVQVAGDDVPADPSVGKLVQRRHAPGEQERLLVGQVHRHAETEMLRHCRHRRHQHQRIEQRHLHRLPQRRVRRAAIHVVDTQHVGQEQPVEQPAFQQLRQPGPVRQPAVLGGAVPRMRPHAMLDVAGARHVEGV